jgi:hypothetical protein
MGFPNRCLITAPVARDLGTEHPNTVRVPGATNGVLQVWDSLDQDYWVSLVDAALTIYATFNAVPNVIKKYVLQVMRYDTAAKDVTGVMKRLADCGVNDNFEVTNAGVVSMKKLGTLVAGDRPTEWEPMHRWLGNIAETL